MQSMRLMICCGSEEDGNVRSYCEQDKGTDCEYGDSDTGMESDLLCVLSV